MKKYHYTDSGLDNIWLLDGFSMQKINGEDAISIENLDSLHHAIGSTIVTSQHKISPQELRFLRIEMSLSQKNLAAFLGVDPQTVARWEKNECPINGTAERMLRALYMSFLDGDTDVHELCKKFAELDELESSKKREFQKTDGEWQLTA